MTETKSAKSIPLGWLLGLVFLIGLGIALGYLFNGAVFQKPVTPIGLSIALGLAWSWIFFQLVDLIGQWVALLSDPVPADIDLSNPSAIAQCAAGVKTSPDFFGRIRRLLEAAGGLRARGVIGLASFQSARARKAAWSGAALALILFGVAAWQGVSTAPVVAGLIALAVLLYARQTLLGRMDQYIEARILSRLPGGATFTFPVEEMGAAIDQAFGKYMPQPEKMASAIQEAVQTAARTIGDQTREAQQSLAAAQASIADSLAGTTGEITGKLEHVQEMLAKSLIGTTGEVGGKLEQIQQAMAKSFSEVGGEITTKLEAFQQALSQNLSGMTGQLQQQMEAVQKLIAENLTGAGEDAARQLQQAGQVLEGLAARLGETYGSGAKQLENVLDKHAKEMNSASSTWKGDLDSVMQSHAQKVAEANDKLARQLDKIAAIEADVSKVLHLEEAVDGALKSVTATEEFGNLMQSLRGYLEETRATLQELARPRTITLVESEEA